MGERAGNFLWQRAAFTKPNTVRFTKNTDLGLNAVELLFATAFAVAGRRRMRLMERMGMPTSTAGTAEHLGIAGINLIWCVTALL